MTTESPSAGPERDERPWGAWEVLGEGAGWKVKRIEVRPGARLSYQTHRHRSERWTVVEGTATCVVEGETVELPVGRSVDVPLGAAHRITNRSDEVLVLVEVQLGDYLGEDDIVRIEDDYGRVGSEAQ
jgi:mannose-6-phosphate isomerase-like protein (cupin superfamily)